MSQIELIRSCVHKDKQSEIEQLFNEKGLNDTVIHIWENVWTEEEKVKAEKAVKNELIRSCVHEDKQSETEQLLKEKGLNETMIHIWEKVWTEEEKAEAEKSVKKENEESKYYKLLFIEYNMKEHFKQVKSHRESIYKAYCKLKDFVSNMKEEDAIKHDKSKYDFSQAVGYTARWVHMLDNDSWKKSLNDHYEREEHHPQFYELKLNQPKSKETRMDKRYLEESLIDMVGSRWERNLKGDENASLTDLVDFDPKYLTRYQEDDFKEVWDLIQKIKDSDKKQ